MINPELALTCKTKLFDFLEQYRVKKGEAFTHTSINPNGSYKIQSAQKKEFFQLYIRAIRAGAQLHILEKPRLQGPIIKDYDIKYVHDSNHRLYTLMDVKAAVRINNELIRKYVNTPIENIKAYVFEKKVPTEKSESVYKDGFHILYPDICISQPLQYLIRYREIEELEKINWLTKIDKSEGYNKIVDEAVISRNNWYMYKSGKLEGNNYDLTHIFDYNLNEIGIDTIKSTKDRCLKFSIRNYSKEDLMPLNDPHTEDEILELCYTLEIYKREDSPSFQTDLKYKFVDGKKIETLVSLLSTERWRHYLDWISIGWCLRNISIDLLPLWIDYTLKNSPERFKDGETSECENKWKNFRSEGYNLYSLHKWAKIDNPEGYKKYKETEIDRFISMGISGTTYDIAKLLYEKYHFQFKCASIKHDIWYEFKEHRWRCIENAYSLKNKISEELYPIYCELYKTYSEKAKSCESKLIADSYDDKRKKLVGLMKSLKTNKFKNDVISECKSIFLDIEFNDLLDESRHLLCFENGVYDLEQGIFRDGNPEDYLSLSTKLNYIEYKPDSPELKEILKFIHDVFPDEDLREYVLTLLASCLSGHNKDQKFYILTGTGANGKSVTIDLLNGVMGEYVVTMSPTIITSKRAASNAATPELARTKGKRAVILQEPENNEQIYVGKMKELTGCDRIYSRELYKMPVEFKPQFKLFLICNNLPNIPSNDGGTWRRIRAIPFKSKFVDNPDSKNMYEKKIKDNISRELLKCREAFMFILLQKFKHYQKYGVTEPACVKSKTDQYKQENDIYLEFINENIDETNSEQDMISFRDLFEAFKEWTKNSAYTKKINKHEFKANMIEKLGNFNNPITFTWTKIKNRNAMIKDTENELDE